MEMKNEEYVSYDNLGKTIIKFPDADAVIKRGLDFFLGKNAQWLPPYEKVSEWFADNEGLGLFMFGKSGLGKTLLAMKIFPVIFKHYVHLNDILYVQSYDLNDYMKNPYDRTALKSSMPLVIDDVGVESMTNDYGVKHDVFSEIVDNAEKKNRLIILTSNLSEEEMNERYGSRTLDRLYSITKGIFFDGKSLRRL